MDNTIMTEKIARRGVKTPVSYEPDVLEKLSVRQFAEQGGTVFSTQATVEEVREWLNRNKTEIRNYFIVVDNDGSFKGIISSSSLFSLHHNKNAAIGSLIKRKPFVVTANDSLKTAVEMMANENLDVLPVVSRDTNHVDGILSYRNILSAYKHHFEEHRESVPISLRRRTLKIFLHGKRRLALLKERK